MNNLFGEIIGFFCWKYFNSFSSPKKLFAHFRTKLMYKLTALHFVIGLGIP